MQSYSFIVAKFGSNDHNVLTVLFMPSVSPPGIRCRKKEAALKPLKASSLRPLDLD